MTQTIETTATPVSGTPATPATSSAPKCCKCDRPAELRFVWPWGAVDHCCSLDRVTVSNNFSALGGPPPRFDELAPPAPAAPTAAELETVPPPRLAHDAGGPPAGAHVLATSTPATALGEGTVALVNITNRAGSMRFLLRRPGQGDIDGSTSELAIVLQTLGLIPTAAAAAPPVVQQSGPALPVGAAAALASGGAAHRPLPPPNLAPPPPIRPPMTTNPGMRGRVAGRHPIGNLPAAAPGAPPAAPAAPGGTAEPSPSPAASAPPVQAAPTGGETLPGAESVLEGPPTSPINPPPKA